MSQKAVAVAIEYYQANVSRLERGKQRKVSYEIGERIKKLHRQMARAA